MILRRRPDGRRAARRPIAKRMVVMLLATALVFGAIFGFLWYRDRAIEQFLATSREPPAAVAATTAELAPWQPLIQAVGALRAVQGVDVSTEVAGVVASIGFESGDTVEQGQVLVQLNAEADRAQLEAARVAAELAQVAYRRAREQFAVQAVSRAALDQAAAELKSARAQVEQQEALVARKTIRAPFAGRLGIRNVNIGQYLNPGDAIVTLQALDPIYADFTLPQQQLAQISTGQPVSVRANVHAARTYAGTITAIAPRVDPATRNLEVQATLENPERQLLPGMFVTVTVRTGDAAPRLTLPQTAIAFNPYGSTVYVLERTDQRNGEGQPIYIARQRFVETGETRAGDVAVTSGVERGELVVTAGQLKLRNGSPAVIQRAGAGGGEPASASPPEAAAQGGASER